MLAYYPEIDAGITTQSNNASFDGSIAFRLAAAFFGDYMDPEGSATDDEESAFDPSKDALLLWVVMPASISG